MIASSPWRRERVFAYLDPFSEQHALGKGYQLSHSLIAIGRARSLALAWAAVSKNCTGCPRRIPTSCSQ